MKIIISSLLLLLSNPSFPWDSTAAKFYPLAIGNLWSYHFVQYTQGACVPMSSYDYIISVVSDTIMSNNKKYFKFSNGDFERIDSSSMNVYKYISGGNEILLDSLLARKNDYFRGNRFGTSFNYQVVDTQSIVFANESRRCKMIRYLTIGDFHYKLVFGVGLYYKVNCELGGNHISLNGCIINGVQYGTIIGIKNLNGEMPVVFSLYQNYPNPFNPVTNIKFDIPVLQSPLYERGNKGGFVRLIVYDILGREVITLVNQELQPGTYEAEWDGSNYPSGLYFYKLVVCEANPLSAASFSEVKKMVLIK